MAIRWQSDGNPMAIRWQSIAIRRADSMHTARAGGAAASAQAWSPPCSWRGAGAATPSSRPPHTTSAAACRP
eukprot:1779080-Prymnesium_polylepis.1